jgi:hypothetical protein
MNFVQRFLQNLSKNAVFTNVQWGERIEQRSTPHQSKGCRVIVTFGDKGNYRATTP